MSKIYGMITGILFTWIRIVLINKSSPFLLIWKSLQGWWENLIVLTLISIAWLICWLTVVLGPPATFGLFCAVNELVLENTTSFRTAFDGARRYFLISWVWMVANVFVFGLLLVNVWFYGQIQSTFAGAVQIFTLFLAFFWFGIQFYGLPFFLLQEKKSLLLAWRNAAYTAMSSPLRALVIWIVILVLVALLAAVVPIIAGVPTLAALLGAIGIRERLIAYGLVEPETLEKEENK